jgi:alkylhydroperoxidase family enzyme
VSFIALPVPDADAQRRFAEDVAELGYVMNATRLWAYQPGVATELFDLMGRMVSAAGLTFRQRAILVAACASGLGDAYCSLAWGSKLAGVSDVDVAAGVLRGTDAGLTAAERALAGWARAVARDPNGTGRADVQALRDAGFDDGQVFAITTFVALRLAFSTVNDALGARPDAAYRSSAPATVLDAVTYGRPIEDAAG